MGRGVIKSGKEFNVSIEKLKIEEFLFYKNTVNYYDVGIYLNTTLKSSDEITFYLMKNNSQISNLGTYTYSQLSQKNDIVDIGELSSGTQVPVSNQILDKNYIRINDDRSVLQGSGYYIIGIMNENTAEERVMETDVIKTVPSVSYLPSPSTGTDTISFGTYNINLYLENYYIQSSDNIIFKINNSTDSISTSNATSINYEFSERKASYDFLVISNALFNTTVTNPLAKQRTADITSNNVSAFIGDTEAYNVNQIECGFDNQLNEGNLSPTNIVSKNYQMYIPIHDGGSALTIENTEFLSSNFLLTGEITNVSFSGGVYSFTVNYNPLPSKQVSDITFRFSDLVEITFNDVTFFV